MLVLYGLGGAIPAICAQGFTGSCILNVDNSTNRDRALGVWVMGHQGARITHPQERGGGTDSGNHGNLSDDDEIGYKGTSQLESRTTTFVQTKLPQLNDEGVEIMETSVTYKRSTGKQSNEHFWASTVVQIVHHSSWRRRSISSTLDIEGLEGKGKKKMTTIGASIIGAVFN